MSLKFFNLLPQNTSFNRNLPFHHPITRPMTRIHSIRRYEDENDDGILNNLRMKPKRIKKGLTDSDLSRDLAREIAKANTISDQRQEAMKKSSEILWGEFCKHMCMNEEEVRNKWRKIGEEEKSVWIKEFVDEWGVDFRPLSVRSVKEMVENECLDAEKIIESSSSSSSPSLSSFSGLFPGLKRIIGFE